MILVRFRKLICKPDNRFEPSAQGRLITISMTRLMITLFLRLHPSKSIQNAMMFSNTAITVLSAAKLKKIKNNVPHRLPKGMLANTLGKVTNTSDGPLSG